MLIVKVVEAAPPDGVTVVGLKEHEAPLGNPEHAKLTAELKPFCGVTVNVVVPVPPAFAVNEVGDAAKVKLGGGKLIVYVADATALAAWHVAYAIARIVSEEPTAIGPA